MGGRAWGSEPSLQPPHCPLSPPQGLHLANVKVDGPKVTEEAGTQPGQDIQLLNSWIQGKINTTYFPLQKKTEGARPPASVHLKPGVTDGKVPQISTPGSKLHLNLERPGRDPPHTRLKDLAHIKSGHTGAAHGHSIC